MKLPAWLRPVVGGCELRVKIIPGARQTAIVGEFGDRLKIRIAEPPEGGRANRALEELLNDMTGQPCQVIAGHRSAQKTILVSHAVGPSLAVLLNPR